MSESTTPRRRRPHPAARHASPEDATRAEVSVAVYPARIGRQSSPVELSPSAALRLAESADRAALAAQTAPSRTELLRRRTRRPHPTELDPSWSLPATVRAAEEHSSTPKRTLMDRLLRRRKGH